MPTENRSSNTEQMVSVPREWVESYAGLLEERCAYKASERVQAVLAQPPAQQQGEPVAWTYLLGGERRFFPTDPRPSHGAHANLITDAQPVYTHADPGEVERLRYKADLYDEVWELATGLGYMNVTTAISSLRAQLAERDEHGFWTHPAWPSTEEELIPYAWFYDRGLDVKQVEFEYDAPETLQAAWYHDGTADCTSWNSTQPAGDGLFIFSIHVTEDGPICVWVRHKVQP